MVHKAAFIIITAGLLSLFAPATPAEVIDRVVAFVDDEAITLGELEESLAETRMLRGDVSRREVLGTMINRVLMLKEARKLKFDARDDDETLRDYISLKVEGFIKPDKEEMKRYYEKNASRFGGASFEEKKEEIERLLKEKRINENLKRHIRELREKAYIKIVETKP